MHIYVEDFISPGPLSREPKKKYEINNSFTLGELVEKFKYGEYFIVVNGCALPYTYVLQEGDTVTMIPHLIGG